MKRLLHSLPGCLIIFSVAFASQLSLSAAPKTAKKRPATIYTQSEFKLSQERMAAIDAILDRIIKRKLDLSKDSTILLIETEISTKMPLVPVAPVSNKSISHFGAEARKQIKGVSYSSEMANFRVAAEKEAAVKFPLEKPRTKVKFEYQKGPYLEKVEGIFFVTSDRYVQINDKRIPFVDLPNEIRSLFDRKFNAELRQNYVEGKVRLLEQQKNKEVQELFTKLLANQDLLNEKNGYIYDKNSKQWITAKDYLTEQLPVAKEKYKKYMAEQKLQQEKARELAAQRAREQAGSRAVTAIDTSDEKKYQEVLNAAKEKRAKIRQTLSGVDAYQGFRNALWGASRSDVAYIFSRVQGARYEYIDFNSKLVLPRYFPAEVFFHFNNDQLNQTVISYGKFPPKSKDEKAEASDVKRIFSSEDFNNLIISLHDMCGLSDEEKDTPQRDLFKEIANGSLTPEKLHPPQESAEKTEKKDQEAEAVVVKDFSFTWTGKETDMVLTFRYDFESDTYQNVQLSKKLKDTEEESK